MPRWLAHALAGFCVVALFGLTGIVRANFINVTSPTSNTLPVPCLGYDALSASESTRPDDPAERAHRAADFIRRAKKGFEEQGSATKPIS